MVQRQDPPGPVCRECGDSGWKMVSSTDHLGRNIQKAARCECTLKKHHASLMERAKIPTRYQHCNFESFEHSGSFGNLAVPYMAARRMCDEYPLEREGLLLIGPIGVGKTHLAISILKNLITEKRAKCLFVDYRQLLKEIKDTYNASVDATEMDVLRPVFDAEVLLLDELGAARATDWVWDTVSLILNNRYNDRRTTIITTNYKDLAAGGVSDGSAARATREETLGDRIGERMRSRLHEMCRVVQIEGKDFRTTIRNASYER